MELLLTGERHQELQAVRALARQVELLREGTESPAVDVMLRKAHMYLQVARMLLGDAVVFPWTEPADQEGQA